MTGLQSGTPAGALTPQNYSNSSQEAAIQDATGRATFQPTPSTAQTLQTSASSGLQVVDPAQSQQVLGIDTVSLNREASKDPASALLFPVALLALVSFISFLYLWRRMNILQLEKIIDHDKPSEDKQD